MKRFSVGRSAALTHTLEADDGTIITPTGATVAVTRNGVSVVSGSATVVGSEMQYDAGVLPQGCYAAKWTAGSNFDTTYFEVVGGQLFAVSALRRWSAEITAERFPSSKVVDKRDLVTDDFEKITGRSFVPRTVRLPWNGSSTLLPRMDIHSVKLFDAAGVEQTATLDTVGPFTLLYSDSCDIGWTVELDYGFREPPPKVADVAMLYCRWLLFNEKSAVPERATSYQPAEGGTFQIATPGIGKSKTGIPDVDRVLADYTLEIVNSIGVL